MELSRFNVWTDRRDGTLILFNSMTGALATFSKEHAGVVKTALETNQPKTIPSDFMRAFEEDGYIVESRAQELTAIQNLVLRRQGWMHECFLSILLSLDCNFGCVYCFEDKTGEHMSDEVAQRITALVRQKASSVNRLSVDWYGGEPLISFKRIVELNNQFMDICHAAGVSYENSVTTNGYLLTKPVIAYLKETPLTHLQITIDGPPDLHNRNRPLKNGGPTFDRILGNIEMAIAAGMEVIVRVNITRQNADRIPELYCIMEDRGLKNRLHLMLKPVVSSPANPCEEMCLSGVALAQKMTGIYRWAADRGWIVFPNVDKMQCMGFCIADYPNQLIIDPRGKLYKCGELFDARESIGHIESDGTPVVDTGKYNQFFLKSPLSFPECRECRILPICMGGCNMKRHWHGINCCEELKHDLPGFLKALVKNQENMAT